MDIWRGEPESPDLIKALVVRLRAARLGLAAVLDSQKKLVGIVTGEDMIKRLVQSV